MVSDSSEPGENTTATNRSANSDLCVVGIKKTNLPSQSGANRARLSNSTLTSSATSNIGMIDVANFHASSSSAASNTSLGGVLNSQDTPSNFFAASDTRLASFPNNLNDSSSSSAIGSRPRPHSFGLDIFSSNRHPTTQVTSDLRPNNNNNNNNNNVVLFWIQV
jgi:hypothetical protein